MSDQHDDRHTAEPQRYVKDVADDRAETEFSRWANDPTITDAQFRTAVLAVLDAMMRR